ECEEDYEYLVLEDFHPAGLEPLTGPTGYNGNELQGYMEPYDRKMVFFVRHLKRGEHRVSYRLRAATPGRFSALPAQVSAVYTPELSGNSGEFQLRVTPEDSR
ncbi:MAG: hypothetical protein V3T77_00555, partial [Planctomycetota bacterium]